MMIAPLASVANELKDNNAGAIRYGEVVNAFKDALAQMKVELDDEEMGKFVEKTVADAIYT